MVERMGPPRGIDARPKGTSEILREKTPWLAGLAAFLGITYATLELRWKESHDNRPPAADVRPNDGDVSDFILDVVENPPIEPLPPLEIRDRDTESLLQGVVSEQYYEPGDDKLDEQRTKEELKHELSQNVLSMLSQTFETTATISSEADLTDTDEEFALVMQDGAHEGEYVFVINRQGRYWGKIQCGRDGSWQRLTPSDGLTASFETLDDLADYLRDSSYLNE